MRKIFTSITLLAFMFVFTACPKDIGSDDTTPDTALLGNSVSGTIKNMPSGTGYTVKLVYEDEPVSTSDVSANGSFSITLPETVDRSNMEPFGYYLPDEATITGGDVMILSGGEYGLALYRGDEYIDEILFGKYDINVSLTSSSVDITGARLCYSEDNASAKGSWVESDANESVNVVVDITLKKGWNWACETLEINSETGSTVYKITSAIPSGSYVYLYSLVEDWL